MNRGEANAENDYPRHCPVCGGDRIRDLSLEHERWNLYECADCAVQFWWPMVHTEANYYQDTYFAVRDPLRRSFRLGWNHRRFTESPPHSPASEHSLLDIGCGSGTFLTAARDLGYEVHGLDLNQYAVQKAKELHNLENVFCGTLSVFLAQNPGKRFDVVTLFEVLEHIDDPVGLMDQIRSILKPQGFIALSVPNAERFMIRRELSDFPPHHLTWWNAATLQTFLSSRSFSPARMLIQPLTFARVIYGLLDSCSLPLIYRATRTRLSIGISKSRRSVVLGGPFFRLVTGMLKAVAYAVLAVPGSFLLLRGKARGERGWFIYALVQHSVNSL